MTQYIDEDVQLTPGDLLDVTFLETGTPDDVRAAVHDVKQALAKDSRFNYQGSREELRDDETYLIVTVQVRATPKVPMVAVPAEGGTWRAVSADSFEAQLWQQRNNLPMIVAGTGGSSAVQTVGKMLPWLTAIAGLRYGAMTYHEYQVSKHPVVGLMREMNSTTKLLLVLAVLLIFRGEIARFLKL